jgi:hypothetical protein
MDGSHEQPREHDAVFPARRSDPRNTISCRFFRVKITLDRRKTTIAPDIVTGHLNSVREASPSRLNLCVAAATAETVLPPWMRAAFLYDLVLAR